MKNDVTFKNYATILAKNNKCVPKITGFFSPDLAH